MASKSGLVEAIAHEAVARDKGVALLGRVGVVVGESVRSNSTVARWPEKAARWSGVWPLMVSGVLSNRSSDGEDEESAMSFEMTLLKPCEAA